MFVCFCWYAQWRYVHPIRIISVIALNIFNSKESSGGWRGTSKGLWLPSRSCLFSRFASLPGVWHWLELEMNVAYGNPWNWPTPGSPSFLQWKFPFSKPISCGGRTPEQPIYHWHQDWQWSRKTFSHLCSVFLQHSHKQTFAVVTPYWKMTSTKLGNVIDTECHVSLSVWTWTLAIIFIKVIKCSGRWH